VNEALSLDLEKRVARIDMWTDDEHVELQWDMPAADGGEFHISKTTSPQHPTCTVLLSSFLPPKPSIYRCDK
jgi:hypothetical protein